MPQSEESGFVLEVGKVAASAVRWTQVDIAERMSLLDRLLRDFDAVSSEWVSRSAAHKEDVNHEAVLAEEWLSGPLCILRNLRLLRTALAGIAESGTPAIPGAVRSLPSADGREQFAVEVLPADVLDRFVFPGFRAEVLLEPGMPSFGARPGQASGYRDTPASGCELVLGAGNISSIAVTDVLYKMFVENRTVLLKTNPVLEYLSPLLAQGLAALTEAGYLAIVDGDAAVGRSLVVRPEFSGIHVTGSHATHAAILEALRGHGGPIPRITSELGNISPVIVVPGPWEDADFPYQAQNLASMLVNNAGFNCNAARVIILPENWPGSQKLADAFVECLAGIPSRRAYYPGARQRFRAFSDAHPDALQVGDAGEDRLPWMFIPGISPEAKNEICFVIESFCGICAEVRLPGATPAEFLANAVRFANTRLWGTLNASLIVDPVSEREASTAAALEQAIADLKYGTVCVNHWPGIAFGVMTTPWGGYPGQTLDDPQSGIGSVHNTLMLDKPQKAVVRSPFRSSTVPPWFPTARGAWRMIAKLAAMQAKG